MKRSSARLAALESEAAEVSTEPKRKKKAKRMKLSKDENDKSTTTTKVDIEIKKVADESGPLELLEEEYDLSTVPSCELVANINTLKGGMNCLKELLETEDTEESQLSFSQGSQESETSQSDAAERHAAVCQGQAQFNELVKRLKISKKRTDSDGQDYENEFHDENVFDLATRGQLMRSLFSDYDEKTRLYDLHCTKIKNASRKKMFRHFNKIKDDMKKIFEGKLDSVRLKLFTSRDPVDRSNLEKLSVVDPFSNLQAMEISEWLQPFLFPKPMRFNQENFVDFIKLVLLPEALIRVYSSINKTSHNQSETEMRWGPRYDGPIDTS